jgi:hypothetical protein
MKDRPAVCWFLVLLMNSIMRFLGIITCKTESRNFQSGMSGLEGESRVGDLTSQTPDFPLLFET